MLYRMAWQAAAQAAVAIWYGSQDLNGNQD